MNTMEMMKYAIANPGVLYKQNYGNLNRDWFVCFDGAFGLCFVTDARAFIKYVETSPAFMIAKWERYEKPVDWSNVPVDTKVVCTYNGEKHNMHFAFVKNGKPHVWYNGCTSYSTPNGVTKSGWDSVELHEQTTE